MTRTALTLTFCLGIGLSACENPGGEESSFALGVPRQDTLLMKVPGGTNGALMLEESNQALLGETSEWYRLTRGVSAVVNTGAIAVGALVKWVTHYPPTTVTQDQAIWGPHTSPLDPIAWKVTVTRIADHQYQYVFEGRGKNDPTAPFITVLSGTHSPALGPLGRELEGFGAGTFTLDWNARATLPSPNPDEIGTINYRYAHPGPAQKVEITAQFRGVKDKDKPGKLVDADYVYVQNPQAEGSMDFVHTVPATATTTENTAKVHSRWLWSGAGRTDVSAFVDGNTGSLSECWDARYLSVYKTTSWIGTPAHNYGQEANCAFPTAEPSTL